MVNESLISYILSTLIISSGLLVITAENPLYSVLFLILTFLNGAGLLINFHLDYLGLTLLIVYIGAIAILFIFIIMMLNLNKVLSYKKETNYIPIGVIMALIFTLQLVSLIGNQKIPNLKRETINLIKPYNLQSQDETTLISIGERFYTEGKTYFLLAGIILLLGLIGAIVLTKQDPNESKVM